MEKVNYKNGGILMITVVITTYKRELDLLRAAIESVLAQTYQDIEIILVDDNGLGTEYQVQNALIFGEESKVHYIANKRNQGAQYSRNIGILNSSGEYIAFLDDDDLWAPEKLEKQLTVCADESVGLVFCEGYIFHDNDLKNVTSYHQGTIKENPSFSDMLYDDCVGTTTQAFIRRECFASVGMFDPEMPARQDYEMWIRISKKWKIQCVEEPLFYHRIHSSEQISQSHQKSYDGNCKILKKYREEYKKNPYAMAKRLMRISYICFSMKHYGLAASYLSRAFFKSPKCAFQTIKNRQVLR